MIKSHKAAFPSLLSYLKPMLVCARRHFRMPLLYLKVVPSFNQLAPRSHSTVKVFFRPETLPSTTLQFPVHFHYFIS